MALNIVLSSYNTKDYKAETSQRVSLTIPNHLGNEILYTNAQSIHSYGNIAQVMIQAGGEGADHRTLFNMEATAKDIATVEVLRDALDEMLDVMRASEVDSVGDEG